MMALWWPFEGLFGGPPSPSSAATLRKRNVTETREVIVIGAGVAGLTCAKELAAAGKDVLVLEASDRVGGRYANAPLCLCVCQPLAARLIGGWSK